MNLKNTFYDHAASKVMLALSILLLVLLIFQAGLYIGYRQATFSYAWTNNYSQDFDDPRSIFAPFLHENGDMNPHGIIGDIISINLPVVLLKSIDNMEKIITVSSTTTIRGFTANGPLPNSLKIGDHIIVIGAPNEQGEIQASFIRILPTVRQ